MITKKNEDTSQRKRVSRGPKLHRLSIDGCPGRGLIKLNRECSSNQWIQLPGANDTANRHTWASGPKFPKLDECTHFHYDTVTLGDKFSVNIRAEYGDHQLQINKNNDSRVTVYYVHVKCNGSSWTIARRYTDTVTFDIQLHRCIFDRRYSMLPVLSSELDASENYKDAFEQLSQYFKRFTTLIQDTVQVKCGSVLNWLEMDNKGNHFLWHVNSGINVPAIAVATVTRNYVRREDDELELRVGDLVSIIDMPNATESQWWRGKHSNKVGFFPSSCVEIIPGSMHNGTTRKQSLSSSRICSKIAVVRCDGGIVESPAIDSNIHHDKKKKRLKGRLAILFASRPDRDSLRQQGILRGRVFGAHLSEHLYDTNTTVPLIVRVCCDTIEKTGNIDGIYRKSGITSNVQKLRQEFDSDQPPTSILNQDYLNDIHCVSSLCKQYFRELPDPLLTFQLYDNFAEAVSFTTLDMKLTAIRKVVQQLPPFHYSTLGYLMKHLSKIASQSHSHGMHSRNLALVWAPNLLKPLASETDASAFTEIKIQSVVLQFLIDHADIIFCEEDTTALILGTPTSVRLSVSSSQYTACSSPQDNISLTSSVAMVNAAGFRSAQGRRGGGYPKRYSHSDTAGFDLDSISNVSDVGGASADIIRNRTTSDVTHTPTAARYQYRMKIPLLELADAQRAHAVSEQDLHDTDNSNKSFFRKRINKKKKMLSSGSLRASDYNHTNSFPTNWSKMLLNKIRRTQSFSHSRPTISGPCGFVADPYSTVINNAQQIIPGVGVDVSENTRPDENHSISSKLSSLNSSTLKQNVLLLGNATNAETGSFDKSAFVNEWFSDSMKQFLDGAPLSAIQPTKITDRSVVVAPPRTMSVSTTTSPRCEIRRSKSLPHKRRNKKNDDIAFVLRELQDVPNGELTEQVIQKFNSIMCNSNQHEKSNDQSIKRSSVNLDDIDQRPAKQPRPLSCPSYCSENIVPSIRKSHSLRCSTSNLILIQNQRKVSFNVTKSAHLRV